jgi:dipeptidyl aminopeptidase/acylaminoacyl peptidase
LWVASLASLPGCDWLDDASPGLELRHEDYAAARKDFRTKLVRRGPSLQPGEALRVPSTAEVIEFESGDLKLLAFVTPDPGDSTKRSAVLFLHGGFAFGAEDWEMAKPYRDAGFVTMVPVLRGENGQPGTFTMFYDEVDDVLAAGNSLGNLPYVDPARIFLAGHSAGGTLACLAALTSKQFKAAAAFSASLDMVVLGYSRPEIVPFDKGDIREYRLRSPIAYANSFKCPVRLFYGSSEWGFRVPSQKTAALAKQKGLDVEAVAASGDHFTSVPAAMRQSIEFFSSNLR